MVKSVFNIVAPLFLTAGALLAGDFILIASRAPSKVKPDWPTAVLAGAVGMLASELLSLLSWQFTAWLVPALGEAGASWLDVAISPLIAAILAAYIIGKKFKMPWKNAYISAAAGLLPAFLIYSILLGIFSGFLTGAN